MKVFVYRNLHQDCISIKALEGPNAGRVIAHVHSAIVIDAQFKVSQAGREKVLRERQKNVHAGVVGCLVGADVIAVRYADTTIPAVPITDSNAFALGRTVKYNPYLFSHFFDSQSNARISEAAWCQITKHGVQALDASPLVTL